jgi:hypothetical protein
MKMEKDRLKSQSETTKAYQKRQEFLDYEENALESIASLSKATKKIIDGKFTTESSLASVTQRVIKMKQAEVNLEGDALQKSIARRQTLEGLQAAVIQQAKSLAHHTGEHIGHEEKIEQFERSISHLTTKQKEEARQLYKIK